jgi:hypothetical protein
MRVRARGLDRTATAAAEIATLRQKLAGAEARIREIETDGRLRLTRTTRSIRCGTHGCTQL